MKINGMEIKRNSYLNKLKNHETNSKLSQCNSEQNKNKTKNIFQSSVQNKNRSEIQKILQTNNNYNNTQGEKNLNEIRIKKIGENFYRRNEEGEDNFYKEKNDDYDDYYSFINDNNRIYIMKAIKEKNIDRLIKEKDKILQKKKQMEEFYCHNYKKKSENEYINQNKKSLNNTNSFLAQKKKTIISKTAEKPIYKKFFELDSNENYQANITVTDKLKEEYLCSNKDHNFSHIKSTKNANPVKIDINNNSVKDNCNTKNNLNLITCKTEDNESIQNLNTTWKDIWKYTNKKSNIYIEENLSTVNDLISEINPKRKVHSSQVKLRESLKKISDNNEYKKYSYTKNSEKNINFYKTSNNYRNNSEMKYIIANFAKIIDMQKANLDIKESNPLFYNFIFNPLKKEINKLNQNYIEAEEEFRKLEFLKTIAFKENNINKLFRKCTKIDLGNDMLNFSNSDHNNQDMNKNNYFERKKNFN